jgi:hypothetical protein
MQLDVQLTTADWEATPRREMLAIWVWLAPGCKAIDAPTLYISLVILHIKILYRGV